MAEGGKPIKGDKTTDCIYTITIDGKVVYVGQTNNFVRRSTEHKGKNMKLMELMNPGSIVTMQRIHGGEHRKPNHDVIVSQHGPQLNAAEEEYMEFYDTLTVKGVAEGKGENKFRWNDRQAPRVSNEEPTSEEDIARYKHLHRCDGPSTEPCDGNELWTQKHIDAMLASKRDAAPSLPP